MQASQRSCVCNCCSKTVPDTRDVRAGAEASTTPVGARTSVGPVVDLLQAMISAPTTSRLIIGPARDKRPSEPPPHFATSPVRLSSPTVQEMDMMW
jgi:hypothetical protein